MYSAKVILDSVNGETGNRLVTMEVTFPRFILAEFNTHRVFSRNSASSRAIPVEKAIEKILSDPFKPQVWTINQKGMQASKFLEDDDKIVFANTVWGTSMTVAIECAKRLSKLGIHKQQTNRLLEPFMWHTVIVSATDWRNFFALRTDPNAQPEMQKTAIEMLNAYLASEPQVIKPGEWHIPYIQPEEKSFLDETTKICVSSARCARVSYLTHSGIRSIDEDMQLYRRLLDGGHMSPFEHPAMAMKTGEKSESNFKGWKQYRKFFSKEADFSGVTIDIPREIQ